MLLHREELKAEAREIETLRIQVDNLEAAAKRAEEQAAKLQKELYATRRERDELTGKLKNAESKISQLEAQLKKLPTGVPSTVTTALPTTIDEARVREIVSEELSAQGGPGIPVDVTLKRTLSEFNVSVNKEKFEVDESTWEGKLLARGLEGFFDEPKGIGKIMQELVRRYDVGDSGGNRTTVNDRLGMLVSKGILDRKQESGQWVYFATEEFKERVKKA